MWPPNNQRCHSDGVLTKHCRWQLATETTGLAGPHPGVRRDIVRVRDANRGDAGVLRAKATPAPTTSVLRAGAHPTQTQTQELSRAALPSMPSILNTSTIPLRLAPDAERFKRDEATKERPRTYSRRRVQDTRDEEQSSSESAASHRMCYQPSNMFFFRGHSYVRALAHAFTCACARKRGKRGGGLLIMMHGRSRMTIDPRIPTMPGRSTSGFHRPGRHR